ncbi:MAG: hypothetical protein JWP87_4414 [Labilithrix sp.]|nr:hypothetical protein [Labilithrix sp.]
MFLGTNETGWLRLATALGLRVHEPLERVTAYVDGASFAHLTRALGSVATPPPRYKHWLYGQWGLPKGRVDVLVLVNVVSDGSSSTTYTHTIARIDPPLFAGMSLAGTSWLERMLSDPPMRVGFPAFDEAFRVRAHAPATAHALLVESAQSGASSVMSMLLGLKAQQLAVHVTDSCVDVRSTGLEEDVAPIRARLDTAARLAAQLGASRMRIRPEPFELARTSDWAAFAARAGLAFDAPRMRISGHVSGLALQIELESDPAGLSTSMAVTLPRSLGLGLRLTQQNALAFLSELFGRQDIRVGHAIFDEAFVVQGQDVGRIQALFQNHVLCNLLLELASVARDIYVDDQRLFFRSTGAFAAAAHLESLVDRVHMLRDALYLAPAPPIGPYR